MEIQYKKNGSPYVMWGDNCIELEKDPIDEDNFYKEKAEQELRETPETIENALRELRHILKGEKELVIPIEKDEFLLKFLRPCKFYVDSAHKKIQNFYKFKESYKDYSHDLMPSSIKLAFQNSVISTLSPRDQHGRRILLIESGERWNHREVPLSEVFRGVQMAVESAMVEPRTQVSGVLCILDMKGLTFSQILQFTPAFAKMAVDWIQDCAPIRLKGVHIVNQPYIFNMLFSIFKPFMRQKLRSRIHFHGYNMKSVLAYIDSSALRSRHGGSLTDPEIPGELLWKMLHHYEEDFKAANSYGYIKKKK